MIAKHFSSLHSDARSHIKERLQVSLSAWEHLHVPWLQNTRFTLHSYIHTLRKFVSENHIMFPPPLLWQSWIRTKMAVFWVVVPRSLVEVYRSFRDTCCLHHALLMEAASTSSSGLPWRWRQYISRKCWYLPANLHGVKTQNNIVFLGPV
jgi:hypothetical protein